jgi:hypothetical protein
MKKYTSSPYLSIFSNKNQDYSYMQIALFILPMFTTAVERALLSPGDLWCKMRKEEQISIELPYANNNEI